MGNNIPYLKDNKILCLRDILKAFLHERTILNELNFGYPAWFYRTYF